MDRRGATTNPIEIPNEWADNGLLTFEEFCVLIRTSQRTVRDWRRCGVGPRWARLDGCGRLYVTVAEARRFLGQTSIRSDRHDQRSAKVESHG